MHFRVVEMELGKVGLGGLLGGREGGRGVSWEGSRLMDKGMGEGRLTES